MALYKYSSYLTASSHAAFDQINSPGSSAPWSGVYRCEGCGREVTSIVGHTLPPQNHHQHSTSQGTIRWRLAVTHNS
jgi:hypothetical protein